MSSINLEKNSTALPEEETPHLEEGQDGSALIVFKKNFEWYKERMSFRFRIEMNVLMCFKQIPSAQIFRNIDKYTPRVCRQHVYHIQNESPVQGF